MENKKQLKDKDGIQYNIEYTIVFCARYRRKLFKDSQVEKRLQEYIVEWCEKEGVDVLEMLCGIDYVHLQLSCKPEQSPVGLVKQIKAYTGKKLRQEFLHLSKMPSVWTTNFLVSTKEVSYEMVQNFVGLQKTRY